MIGERLRSLVLASQGESGAFPAIAHPPSGSVPDENAFVTALIVNLLGEVAADPEIAEARQRGLDFLLRCERPGRPGAFSFYPAYAHPAWIGEFLPVDADDTALSALALFRAGRWRRSALRREVREVLGRHRVEERPHGAPWFRAGVYPTWLDAGRLHNPIDVCVNLNVAVLIQESGVGSRHGHGGILEMVGAALDWVGDSPERARAITPYYPHPAELGHALERAVAAGVRGAGGLLKRLRAQAWSRCEDPVSAPICSSLGAGVVWTSPVLQAVRCWTRTETTEPELEAALTASLSEFHIYGNGLRCRP